MLTNTTSGEARTGTYQITVRIYDQETGGTALFEETHEDILLTSKDNGVFNLRIGSVEILSLDFNKQYWLSIQVTDSNQNTDGELLPRQPIVSSSYALNTDMIDGLDSLQFIRSDEDDIMDANLTVTGSINVLGYIRGPIDIETGVSSDTFTIDTPQDSSDIIALIFGEDNNEQLYYSLIEDQFHMTDSLSINGGLTVTGLSRLNGGIDVNGANFTITTSGAIHTDSTLDVDGQTTLNNDIYLGNNTSDAISFLGRINSDLTFNGAHTIYTTAGDLTFDPAADIRLGVGSDNTIVSNDITISGNKIFSLTTLAITLIGQDVQTEGDLIVAGNKGISFSATGADLVFAQGAFIENDQNGQLGLGGDVSLSGEMTVFGTGASRFQNGRLYIGSLYPSALATGSGDLFVSNDVEIYQDLSIGGMLTIGGDVFGDDGGVKIQGDLTVTNTLFTDLIDDEVNLGLTIIPDTTFQRDLSINGGELYSQNDLLLNPNQSGSGTLSIGVLTEGDSVVIGGDLTVRGDLSIAGAIPAVELQGTTSDYFIIDAFDTTDTPSLFFKDSDGNEMFRWNDILSTFELSDNLSIAGFLTVESEMIIQGSGVSKFSQGRVYISDTNPSALVTESGDLFVKNDVEIGGDLSVGNDLTLNGSIFSLDGTGMVIENDLTIKGVLFVDDITNDDQTTLSIGDNTHQIAINSSDWDITVEGNISNINDITSDGTLYLTSTTRSPNLSVSGSVELGDSVTDTLTVRGQTTFGTGETIVISDAGDITITGDTYLGDDVLDVFSVTSSGLNIAENGTIYDNNSAVVIADDVSVTGELSVAGELEVYGTGASRFTQGPLYISDLTPSSLATGSGDLFVGDDIEVSGDVSIGGDVTITGDIFSEGGVRFKGDVTVTDTLFVDRIDDEINGAINFVPDVTMDSDLTIEGGDLFSPGNLRINAAQSASGILFLGGEGEGDEVHVEGHVTISGDLTVEPPGHIWGDSAITGTTSDTFTIDTDDTTDTPTLVFEDFDGDETLRWNDLISSFELSDDLSLGGDLTIEKRLIVEASGDRSYFSGAGHTVQITDGTLEIFDAAQPITPSSGFNDEGDLVVGDDVEIKGDLSLGGSVTIAGVIFGDDHTEIVGSLTVGEDLDVRGRIFDGNEAYLDIYEDYLSISGDLTVW